MKPLIAASMIAAAATAASGCAPLDQSVFVEGASFLDPSCAPQGQIKLAQGFLDLGPARNATVPPVYWGHFALRSDLQSTNVTSGDETLAGDSANEFVATAVRSSYRLLSGTTVPEAVEPFYFVVAPGSREGFVQFQMLRQAAATVIASMVPAGGDDTLLITFSFEGNVRSAGDGLLPMHTPKVTFPVRLQNRDPVLPACTPPEVAVLSGPCGNSQESFTYVCQ